MKTTNMGSGYMVLTCIFVLVAAIFSMANGDFCIEGLEDLCENNGRCVEFESEQKCQCPAHWGGYYCEQLNTHCYNGTFLRDPIRCECYPGYGGEYCEFKCECKNGGRGCDVEGKCTCPGEFVGDSCEDELCQFPQIYCSSTNNCSKCAEGYEGEETCTDIDECAVDSPCSLNSTCINIEGSYRCECLPGVTGRHCDVIVKSPCDVTDVNSCGTEGNCTSVDVDELGHLCACKRGFYGERCGEESVICEEHGKCGLDAWCLQSLNSYKCKCDDGYSGEYCQLMTSCDDDVVTCLNGGTCQSCTTSSTCGSDVIVTAAASPLYTCRCTGGYYGNKCERNAEGQLVGMDIDVNYGTAVYTAITCACVIAVVLAAMGVFILNKKRKQQIYTTKPTTTTTPGETETVEPISFTGHSNEVFAELEPAIRVVYSPNI